MTQAATRLAEYERISRERELTHWEQGFVKYLAWRVRGQERFKHRYHNDWLFRRDYLDKCAARRRRRLRVGE